MRIRIPTPLYSYTGNRAEVEAEGATLKDVAADLDRQFPGMRFRMIDEQDQIRPHVKFFINGNQTRNLATLLISSDEVAIVQAFSGG